MSEMQTKFVEIRDEGTRVDAIAIRMSSDDPIPQYYLRRSGHPEDGSSIMLMCVYDGKATNDPYEWEKVGMSIRTMGNAHNWICEHFDEISDGDVVDVQFLLGETKEPKIAERLAVDALFHKPILTDLMRPQDWERAEQDRTCPRCGCHPDQPRLLSTDRFGSVYCQHSCHGNANETVAPPSPEQIGRYRYADPNQEEKP